MYQRHPTIDHYLRKVRRHTQPYYTHLFGKDIKIFPDVMSPKYDRSSQIFLSLMPHQRGKSFLEIGCGCGIVSLFVADQDVQKIVATDINQAAVQNTQENFGLHKVEGEVIFSDLFENVTGRFDTIFFNAPFHGNRPADILEKGTSDEGYQTLKRFFETVSAYLETHGTIILGFSDMGDNTLLRRLAKENHLHIDDLKKKENGDWIAYLYIMSKID